LEYIRVRNYDKFQHYGLKRNPPWIKLYRDLWQNPEFFSLKTPQKLYVIGLFSIASETKNKIICEKKWIQSRLGIKQDIDINAIMDAGFIEDASTPLAPICYQNAILDKDKEIDKEKEKEKTPVAKKESPPTEKPKPENKSPQKEHPKDEAYEIFAREFTEYRQTPYRPTKADWVQLARLRKDFNYNSKGTPNCWVDAIRNYIASPLSKYTLADLCSRFDVFVLGEVDRYGRPAGFNDVKQANKATVKSLDEKGFFE